RLEDAVACYRQALHLQPDLVDAHHNLGNALRAQGRLAEALACYDHALRLRPDHAQVHLSCSLNRLQMGDFERGWAEYECGWGVREFPRPHFPQPVWDGTPLRGRTILLYADHGLGDTIQFIRYAPLIQDRGGLVMVACPKPLARLLAGCRGIERVVAEGDT